MCPEKPGVHSLDKTEPYCSFPWSWPWGSVCSPGAEGKENRESLSSGRSEPQGKSSPSGEQELWANCSGQTKPRSTSALIPPLQAQRRTPLKTQGRMWMCLHLVLILSKPTFTHRCWSSISKTEVTSHMLWKSSQTGFPRTTIIKEMKFFTQYCREHLATF